MIEPVTDGSAEVATSRLMNVFGLANICVEVKVGQDVSEFSRAAETILEGRQFTTIKVDTRRPDKNFPLTSMEVNALVGEHLCKLFGVRANLSEPDETIFVGNCR